MTIVAMLLGWCWGAVAATSGASGAEQETAPSDRYRVLRGALMLRDVPLRLLPSCTGVAPLTPANTVGDYLAGFMAHMHEGGNRLTTQCDPQPRGAQRCQLWLKHRDDTDEWAWGVQFDLDAQGRPRTSSVKCIGSG